MLKIFYRLYERRLYTYRSLEKRASKTFDRNLRGGLQVKYTTKKNLFKLLEGKVKREDYQGA